MPGQGLLAQGGWDGGWRGGWRLEPPPPPRPESIAGNGFSFCRIFYRSVREEPLGHGWNTDFPDSDINFMIRLAELTTIQINRDEKGEPLHAVLRLTDPQLFRFPYIFMSDVGTIGLAREEVEALREYLLRGGFLHVDDFWGERAWDHWKRQIGDVLSPAEYPIEDVGLEDRIFHTVFDIEEIPQVPSIQHWRRSGGGISERGDESAEPHFRGIRDKKGRLMVVMTHNTDIADGWEREGEDEEFFAQFSVKKSYPLGINIVVYALSH
jgi:hypothetical protein